MKKTLGTYMRIFCGAHVIVMVALVLFVSGPLFLNDNALLIYAMHRATQWFNQFGALWGYDPSFSAGFPSQFHMEQQPRAAIHRGAVLSDTRIHTPAGGDGGIRNNSAVVFCSGNEKFRT
jgi:hypothetical protein